MCNTYGDLFARFLEATREFNVGMGQPDKAPFSVDLMNLRLKLVEEEAKELDYELKEASSQVRETGKIERGTAMQIIKESSDLIYVLAGTAATFGLQYSPENPEMGAIVTGYHMILDRGNTYYNIVDVSADRVKFFAQRVLRAGRNVDYESGCGSDWFTEAIEDATTAVIELAEEIHFPLLDAFNAVHASNMSKLGDDGKPIYREDGKVMKGPNYHRPNMSVFVEQDGETNDC